MDVNGKIQQLMDDAQKRADDAQAEMEAAQAEVQAIQDMVKQIDADKKAQYQAGTEYGKSLIVLPSESDDEKIYSQADEDRLVASVKAEKDKEAKDAADDVAQKHADEIKALNEKYSDYEAISAEREQLLSHAEDDKKQITDAKAELDKRLDSLVDDLA